MRRMHDGATRQRGVDLALAATQRAWARLESVRLASPSAIGANKAIRPTQLLQVIGTGGVRWEHLLKLRKASREAARVHIQNGWGCYAVGRSSLMLLRRDKTSLMLLTLNFPNKTLSSSVRGISCAGSYFRINRANSRNLPAYKSAA